MRHEASRRRFLQRSLAAAGSLPLIHAHAQDQHSAKADVLVVGAGIAGLAAARELIARDYSVIVLEGRDRIGGRIWSVDLDGQPVDLGAQWIEGIKSNPLYSFCRKHHIATALSDNDESLAAFDVDGKPIPDHRLERDYEKIEDLLQAACELSERRDADGAGDISFAAGLDAAGLDQLHGVKRRFADWVVNMIVGGDEADDSKNLSLAAVAQRNEEDWTDGDYHVLPGGFSQITHSLAKDLDIRLNHVVDRIAYGGNGVEVTTNRGVFRSDYAIVTLPLGVLKMGKVAFDPPLPKRKLDAIASLGVGVAMKIVLRFPKQFWPDEQFIGYVSDTPGQFVEWTNLSAYAKAPILSLWSHGDIARAMERQSDDQLKKTVMQTIRKCFVNAPDPVAMKASRWASDPFSFGAYSNLPLGSSYDCFDALAEPVHDRLFFAGESTIRRYHASAHGAYFSGRREARRIDDL